MTCSKRITTALALLTLAAWGAPTPMAGGPCAYETSVEEAIAVSVEGDGALFESAGGEVFVSAGDLPTLPKVGETLTLQVERITEGTCTPEIVTVVAAE
ncbi:MAG: hypothetical protein AAFQ22_01885 [Pseudomonadota bacterium]